MYFVRFLMRVSRNEAKKEMKKLGFKCLALGLAVAMLLSLAACKSLSGDDGGNTTTTAVNGADPSDAPTTMGNTQNAAQVQAREAAQPTVPTTKAEILALYTSVMNKAKSEKPAYTKMEYQEITEKNFDQAAVNIALSLASRFMTTKEKAESDPEIHEKGADTTYFPLYEGSAGCLLAPEDAEEAIQTAACRELSDGNYEIVITLNPETDPEPFVSYHGQMFSPISKKVIDTEIEKLRVVKPEYYSIYYHDCTATLVLNPHTQEIVSLRQMTYVQITAKGAIEVKPIRFEIDGTAALQNTLEITDFQY